MSLTIRICLILFSVLVFILMMRKIRKEKVLIADAVFWIILSGALLVLSVFPQIIIFAAELLGFQSTTHLVFLLMIFVLLWKMFTMSLHISQIECKLRASIQELAILKKRLLQAEQQCAQSETQKENKDASNA